MEKIYHYIDQEENRQAFLNQLFEALRIPSISALPEHRGDVRAMAAWLKNALKNDLGFESRLIETSGNPLVFAESPKVPGKPTVLIYGHYDVQPVDPLDLWKSPPFEPTVRDGKIFCRGADDDKGQLLTHLFGVKSYLATGKTLPVQYKFLFEGEEEVGSDSLSAFLQDEKNRELLATDVIVVSDCTMVAPDRPTIIYGLRGVVGFELTLTGPNCDLHSGHYGGSVYNPAIALSKMLAALIDEKGKIQVPGFYDDVIDLTDLEHQAFADLNVDEENVLAQIGLNAGFGEPEYRPVERRCGRPSFDINGLTSGYQGEGGKTIIPSWAKAKFTFRLVPNQKPEQLRDSLKTFLEKLLPPGIKMELVYGQGAGGMVIPLDSDYVRAAVSALTQTMGGPVIFTREGGSIPIVAEMKDQLNAEPLLIGFGLDEDGIHSPNESFRLESFFNGIRSSVALWNELGKMTWDEKRQAWIYA